jgi:transposase
MGSTVARNVGVDISKDTLDVAIHPEGKGFRIANTPEGHRALIKRLEGFEIARIVFEATGAYHRLLQQALVGAGLPWVKVNPRQARRFAQAAGKLAKTDRCDALMLARMGAALELEPNVPVSPTVETMKELVNAVTPSSRIASLSSTARASPSQLSSSVSSLRGSARSTARSKPSTSASKRCARPTQTSASASTS